MEEPAKKIRRLQAGAACENCRRRRSRCDGARPQCSNCHIRSMPCEYPTVQQSDVQPEPTSSISSAAAQRSTSISSRQQLRRRHTATRTHFSVVNDPITPGSLMERSESLSDNDFTTHDSQAQQIYFGISSTFDFTTNPCRKEIDAITTSYRQSRDWLNVIQRTPAPKTSRQMASTESYFEIPKRDLADSLVDAYFRQTHMLYPFIHEGDFRSEYESMWRRGTGKAERFAWFGVLNMVFAYSCQSYASTPTENALAVADPYVTRAKDIVLAHVLKASTLETVQTLLLICYYLQGVGELHECWNLAGLLTRTAQGLGLHVVPCIGKFSAVETELRKRAWGGCLILDRSLSLKFGRPPNLGAQNRDVDLPLEVDDQYIQNNTVTPRQPSGTLSMISFFVSNLRLSCIVSDVSTSLYLRDFDQYSTDTALDGTSQSGGARCNHVLSTVLLLDGQLDSFWEHVPHYLKHESTYLDIGGLEMHSQRVALKAE